MQKLAGEQVPYDVVTGLALNPKLRVYHEVPVRCLDKSGLKAIGTRWVLHVKE